MKVTSIVMRVCGIDKGHMPIVIFYRGKREAEYQFRLGSPSYFRVLRAMQKLGEENND